MNTSSPETEHALRVQPGTLYADRADGASLFLERIRKSPAGWLRKNGACPMIDSAPVVVMVDTSASRSTDGEYCNVVALEYGEEAPLARIAEAIEALQMAYEALTAAGQVDFVPKDER